MKILSIFVVLASASIFTLWLSAKDSASNFSRSRLNNGIFVGAPDQWRWCRDGIELKHFKLLAGEPIKEEPKVKIKGALQALKYDSGVLESPHVFYFDSDGFLVSRDWYTEIKDNPDIPAPTPQTPNNLKVSYPRCVPLSWKGASDLGYHVEVQILHPGNGWNHSFSYYTKNTKAIHNHTGANEGRWRVRSISKEGVGEWSKFITFSCTS